MAYAKKTKGFRRVTVNGNTYRWQLTTGGWNLAKGICNSSTVTLQGMSSGKQQLFLGLPGFRNIWLSLPEGCDNHPAIITPALIADAIRYGFAQGWQPETKAPEIYIVLKDDGFAVRRELT